jgi:Acetyltransferase (GNAT) domain
MAFEFQVKTTGELSPAEITALTQLFREVYGKPCPEDLFLRKFARSCLGRSIHSLMLLDGGLVGAFSAIPVRYRFFGQTLLFANTADLMIAPRHRGSVSRFQSLAEGLYEALAQEGVSFVFCCLRDEIFRLHRVVSGWRAAGRLHYYAAPFRLPYLGPAAALVRTGARLWNRLSPASHLSGEWEFPIEKVNDAAFANYRYQVFPTTYYNLTLPGGSAVYAKDLFYPVSGIPANIRLGLLIDVFPLAKANFDDAVAAIQSMEPQLGVLAYQGYLPFQPRDMIRVPARLEKQSWTLGGRILLPGAVDERVFHLANWNINLSNGDLV